MCGGRERHQRKTHKLKSSCLATGIACLGRRSAPTKEHQNINSSSSKHTKREGGEECATRLFSMLFPCSADHEQQDWPPCKVGFSGWQPINTLDVRNNNNNKATFLQRGTDNISLFSVCFRFFPTTESTNTYMRHHSSTIIAQVTTSRHRGA